jgi:hypothetical protein
VLISLYPPLHPSSLFSLDYYVAFIRVKKRSRTSILGLDRKVEVRKQPEGEVERTETNTRNSWLETLQSSINYFEVRAKKPWTRC